MKSAEIRESFLDFFKERQHTIVPSSSLMPDSPGLLFTNAGMNQFVPIFLNEQPCPFETYRAANTQKCIRAGGKHNDLEDVGLDTYHHTYFEMLGNWSFGEYFKKEAIEWAWELLIEEWKFPKNRLYATVYKPGKRDPAEFDQEAYDIWKGLFKKAGLDPEIHIVYGNKKDNFWMMGETGPCGPCSEIHMDLTPKGDTKGKLVNADSPLCMEIWNLVFIQFNADEGGGFSDLPFRHVDTGMGFERVCAIMQGSKGFKDFTKPISNYNTDVFSPLFKEVSKLCKKKYKATLPSGRPEELNADMTNDVAMRVIVDHIRALTFSIADGILPSNEGRGYVLRRILRRAVRYGRQLGIKELFLYKLVPVITEQLGFVFPELKRNGAAITRVIKGEEESFTKTLDRGIELFNQHVEKNKRFLKAAQMTATSDTPIQIEFPGDVAFELYDTYGFPLDLTELMARENNMTVDIQKFEKLMDEQRQRSKDAQKKSVIKVKDSDEQHINTDFVGFDLKTGVNVEVCNFFIDEPEEKGGTVTARLYITPTPFYGEMGGQVGDTGILEFGGEAIEIIDTLKSSPDSTALITEQVGLLEEISFPLKASVNLDRRKRIESHHSATHILHWALREVLGNTVSQKGSYVGPDRLRFDFSHPEAMTEKEIKKVEKLVIERVEHDAGVQWYELPYKEAKKDNSIMQFFGDKYGDTVRVVDIGGFSKELCGGTHVSSTLDIGCFRLISESAIAAGVRRIEAVCGDAINDHLKPVFVKQNEEVAQLLKKSPKARITLDEPNLKPEVSWDLHLKNRSAIEKLKADIHKLEKKHAKAQEARMQKEAAHLAEEWTKEADTSGPIPFLIKHAKGGDGKFLQITLGELKNHFEGVVVLAGDSNNKVALAASVSKKFTKQIKAGDIIKEIAPHVGGKGGGRPELAQGGGTEPNGIALALKSAKTLLNKI
ncbi:MAG: alanine--tRNA ligase [Verrucomicrobiota bacterium]